MPIGVSTNASNVLSWTVTEVTSPVAPGGSLAGTGSFSASLFFDENNKPLDFNTGQPLSDIEFMQGDEIAFVFDEHDNTGFVGYIDNSSFNGSEGMMTSASFNLITYMNQLSTQRDLPPVLNETPDEIFRIYMRTVFPSLPGNRVNYIGSDTTPRSFIGWTGDVWQALCALAAMLNCEIATTGFYNDGIVIRDIGQRVVDLSNRTAPTQQFRSNNLGRYVDVTYQNQTVISTVLSSTKNISPNPSVEVAVTGYGPGIISHPNVTTNDGRSNLWAAEGDYSYMVEYDCSDHVNTVQVARAYTPVINHNGGEPLFVSLVANMTSTKPSRYNPSGVYEMRLRLFDVADNLIATHTTTASLNTRATINLTSTPANVTKFQVDVSKEWIWNN